MRNFKILGSTAKKKRKKNDFSSNIMTLIEENTIWNGVSRAFNEMIDNDG